MNSNNNKNNNDISYHSHDQRKHYRLTTPIWVHIDNKVYKTKDWSVGGLAIENFHRDVEHGEAFKLKIIIKFQGFNIEFDAHAKAIGTNNNKTRLKFDKLSDRSKNILQFFSQSIISGEMVDFEDTIKRIDMPINLQEENIDQYRKNKPPLRRWPFKAIFFSLLYLIAGILLLSYLVLIIYSNFMHLKVESAVVSASIEEVVSPFDGIIEKYYVKKNDLVDTDQLLVKIKDHELEHKLAIEKTNHSEAKADHELKSKFLATEKNKLNIYEDIGKTKLDELKSNLHEWEERREKVYNDHQRALVLYQKNHISKAEMDMFEAEYETVEHQLGEAKHQLKVQEQALKSVESGHYFSTDQLEGEIPQYIAHLERAKQGVEISKDRIAALEKQIDIRTLKSPFPGHIVDTFKSNGNTVSRGDVLLKLEHNENRYITAYLTQDEIVELNLDNQVTVYIPAIKKRFTGKITHIDRTDGFIDEVEQTYRPRTINDRSALVTIQLNDFTLEKSRELLKPGTPAVVYFNRSFLDNLWHRVQLYFAPSNKP